ncbi:hypothetical protein BDY24DRAFT_391727 [Mrakia frigida]|uniref:uncharacterized protein n=1 Tax=Mrakia frigida TaxID=29902 RepID=UPI003FCC1EA5
MDRTTDFASLEHLPPRHDIESDSEDDSAPRSTRPSSSSSSSSSVVSISIQDWQGSEDSPLIVVVGKEAKRVVEGLEELNEKEAGRVLEGGKTVVGIFYTLGSATILYLRENLQLKIPGPLASAVVEKLQPSRIIALDSYLTSSYITSSSERARALKAKRNPDDHAVRYLATSCPNGLPKLPSTLLPFSPPNHVRSPSAPFLSLVPISTTTLFPDPNLLLLLPSPYPTNEVVEHTVKVLSGLLGAKEWVWKSELVGKRRFSGGEGVGGAIRDEEASGGMYM